MLLLSSRPRIEYTKWGTKSLEPNIFEDSPHVIQAVFDAIQGLMVAVRPNVILQYTVQGCTIQHEKVREVHWRIYNCLYLYNSDALVAGYHWWPDIPSLRMKATTFMHELH